MKSFFGAVFRLRIHLICWSVWIAYEVLTTGLIRGYFSHFLFYAFFYPLNVGLFYLHGKVVLPWSVVPGKGWWWKFPCLLVAELSGYALVSVLLNLLLQQQHATLSNQAFNLMFFVSVLWRGILFVVLATGYYFLVSGLQRRKLAMERALEIERLNTQLLRWERDLLRSQINPHLLFNTLNFVKYAAKRDPGQADEAIQRLSALMRFALEKSEGGLVALSDELEQAKNIIRLNQLRFGTGIFVEMAVELDRDGARVVPVVLLTLVENLFKHGELRDSGFPGQILVRLTGSSLDMETLNRPKRRRIVGPGNIDGTGLENIRARLLLCYPGRHHLEYGMSGAVFYVRLHIDLELDGPLVPSSSAHGLG